MSFREPCDVSVDVISGHARIGAYDMLSVFPYITFILNGRLRLKSEKGPQMFDLFIYGWVNMAISAVQWPCTMHTQKAIQSLV